MRRALPWLISALFTSGAAIASCSANNTSGHGGLGGGGGDPFTATGTGAAGGKSPNQTGGGGTGGGLIIRDGGEDAKPDVMINPCGTQCGPKELCDSDHLGLDDNCNGKADEGCSCTPGQAHFCFLGDPSYRNTPGCFDGVEKCSENGTWGPCVGGKHATPDQKCYASNLQLCHSITAPPFATVDLKTGTGTFSSDADPGSESWAVTCPAGVSPCPTPSGTPAENYTALQSGEYPVVYTKKVNGTTKTCDYSLFVGAPGLRVELTWEHPAGSTGLDLDLHMHQPMDTTAWAVTGETQDCGYADCKAGSFTSTPQQANSPHWFDDSAMPPDPVNWDLDPDPNKNTCYFAPNGFGTTWKNHGAGCHNPRLDTDNITCTPTVTDPTNSTFCAPENINIDYPPPNQWVRVGVHYYWNHSLGFNVHPEVKFYCDGALAGDLGSVPNTNDPTMRDPSGYNAAVTFTPAMGSHIGSNNTFWVVADVLYQPATMCTPSQCIVQPIFADATQMTPLFENDNSQHPDFGPAYPPIPAP